MKQSEDRDAFFAKYSFTRSCSMPCPESGDMMHFEGLEARYVHRLERQVAELEKYVKAQHEKIDWMMNQEFYKWKYREQTDAPKAKP